LGVLIADAFLIAHGMPRFLRATRISPLHDAGLAPQKTREKVKDNRADIWEE
jgi:hypothetical protein